MNIPTGKLCCSLEYRLQVDSRASSVGKIRIQRIFTNFFIKIGKYITRQNRGLKWENCVKSFLPRKSMQKFKTL